MWPQNLCLRSFTKTCQAAASMTVNFFGVRLGVKTGWGLFGEARTVALHVKAAHLPWILGLRAHQYFVVPKAAYGWGCWDPPKTDCEALFNMTTCALNTNHRASKHLRRVWYGGILDLSLKAIIQRFCRVRRMKNQLQWRPLANTSLQKVRKSLRDLDFTEIAPWKWKTKVKQVKPDDQTLDLSRHDKQDQDLQKHIIREAYRRVHFRKWTQQKRRDARELRTHHSEDDLMKYYVNCEAKDLRISFTSHLWGHSF